jgi:hypothetical protein
MNPGFELQGPVIAAAPRGPSAFETGHHRSTRELLRLRRLGEVAAAVASARSGF